MKRGLIVLALMAIVFPVVAQAQDLECRCRTHLFYTQQDYDMEAFYRGCPTENEAWHVKAKYCEDGVRGEGAYVYSSTLHNLNPREAQILRGQLSTTYRAWNKNARRRTIPLYWLADTFYKGLRGQAYEGNICNQQ